MTLVMVIRQRRCGHNEDGIRKSNIKDREQGTGNRELGAGSKEEDHGPEPGTPSQSHSLTDSQIHSRVGELAALADRTEATLSFIGPQA
jgi:hypothetical protein